MKKVFSIILTTLYSIVMVLSLLILLITVGNKIGGERGIFGYSFYNIVTGSMSPTINVHDVIIGKNYNRASDTLEIGDIIVFQKGKDLVTHRIVQVNADGVVTRGDANNVDDAPLPYDQIIAKKVGITFRGVGGIINFIKTKVGFFVVIMMPLVLLVIYESYSFAMKLRAYRKEQREESLESLQAEVDSLKKKLNASQSEHKNE